MPQDAESDVGVLIRRLNADCEKHRRSNASATRDGLLVPATPAILTGRYSGRSWIATGFGSGTGSVSGVGLRSGSGSVSGPGSGGTL